MAVIQVFSFSISSELAARMGLQNATSFRMGFNDDPQEREALMALLRRARTMGGELILEYRGLLRDGRGIASYVMCLPANPIQRFPPVTPGYQAASSTRLSQETHIHLHFARPCDSCYVIRTATAVEVDR